MPGPTTERRALVISMKQFFKSFLISRGQLGISLVIGLVWTFAFAPFELAGVGWVLPALMVSFVPLSSSRRAFFYGGLIGGVHCLSSLYWLLNIPFPPGAVAGWLALSLYLAIYPGLWCAWMSWLMPPTPERGPGTLGSTFVTIAGSPASQRMKWGFAGASGWVLLEYGQAYCLNGFPWNFLGVSQFEMKPLIQIASITGVYGVSFLVVWISLGLVSAVGDIYSKAGTAWVWIRSLIMPGSVFFLCWFWGVTQLTGQKKPDRALDIALIQPSIEQTLLWDSGAASQTFEVVLELTKEALARDPDVVVFPEGNYFSVPADRVRELTVLFADSPTYVILNGIDRVQSAEGERLYNAAFLLDGMEHTLGDYAKRHLVLFGETIPFAGLFPWLKKLIPVGDGFAAGDEPATFPLARLDAATSPLICFEDLFPHEVRSYAGPDIDFLVNLTNDGWFGESAAQRQHFVNAAFRAIENGLPLVRATNNGVTGVVDERGFARTLEEGPERDRHDAGVFLVKLPLPSSRQQTWYSRKGDWFFFPMVFGCLFFGFSGRQRSVIDGSGREV